MSYESDLTTPPDLGRKRHIGPTRVQRPNYVDLLPPCNNACPAGENIQEWLAHAQEGRFREAWETILQARGAHQQAHSYRWRGSERPVRCAPSRSDGSHR